MRIYTLTFIIKKHPTSLSIFKIIELIEKIGVVFDIHFYQIGLKRSLAFYLYLRPAHLKYLKMHVESILFSITGEKVTTFII